MMDIVPVSSRLCNRCKYVLNCDGLPPELFSWSIQRDHHPNLSSLKQCVQDRCRLCTELYLGSGAKLAESPSSPLQLRTVYRRPPTVRGHNQIIQFEILLRETETETSKEISLHVLPLTLSPTTAGPRDIPDWGQGRTRTDSASSIKLLDYWLRNCLENHKECANTLFPTKGQPSRLLDVGEHETDLVKVVPYQYSAVCNRGYLTLSHVWGFTETLKLTASTRHDLEYGVPLERLPNLFRQAIAITRRLNFRFIWIDSLCILQDSNEDWQRESAAMGSIYGGGTLNIAATDAADCQGDLYFERDPIYAETLRIRIKMFPGMASNVEEGWKFFDAVPLDIWRDNVDTAILNTRAWVAQERTLTPRLVQFSRNQLFWECKTSQACESNPYGLNVPRHSLIETRVMKVIDALTQATANHDQEVQNNTTAIIPPELAKLTTHAHLAWQQIVMSYSACDITFDKDILVAISGLAKIFERALGDTYLAGLWEGKLPYCLLWSCQTRTDLHTKQVSRPHRVGFGQQNSEWRAPSWSWASIKGGSVRYLANLFDLTARTVQDPDVVLVDLLDYGLESVSSDTTSQLSDAWLKLKAKPFKLNWRPARHEIRNAAGLIRTCFIRLPDRELSGAVIFDDATELSELEQGELEKTFAFAIPIMAVCRGVARSGGNPQRGEIRGLVLGTKVQTPLGTVGQPRIAQFTLRILRATTSMEMRRILGAIGATEEEGVVLV